METHKIKKYSILAKFKKDLSISFIVEMDHEFNIRIAMNKFSVIPNKSSIDMVEVWAINNETQVIVAKKSTTEEIWFEEEFFSLSQNEHPIPMINNRLEQPRWL